MASPTDRVSAPPLAFDLAARLAAIYHKKHRGYRLERLRQELRKRDYGACLLSGPINIRYATGSRNTYQVFNLGRSSLDGSTHTGHGG